MFPLPGAASFGLDNYDDGSNMFSRQQYWSLGRWHITKR